MAAGILPRSAAGSLGGRAEARSGRGDPNPIPYTATRAFIGLQIKSTGRGREVASRLQIESGDGSEEQCAAASVP